MRFDKAFILDNFKTTSDVDKQEFSVDLENFNINAKGHIVPGDVFFRLNDEVSRINNSHLPFFTPYLFAEIKNLYLGNGGGFIAPPRDPNYNFQIYTELILGMSRDDKRLDIYTAKYSPTNKTLNFTFKRTLEGTFDKPVSFKQFYRNYYIANGHDKLIAMTEDADDTYYTDNEAVPVASCVEEYKNHLFCAGDPQNPNLIVVSAVGNGLDWTGENGSYDNFFNVGLDDTDAIVGLKNFNDKLYIFKEKTLWVLQGYSYESFQIYKIADIGAIEQSAIEILNGALYFIGDNFMLYRITDTITNLSYGRADVENLEYTYYSENNDVPYLYSNNNILYIGYWGHTIYLYDTMKDMFSKSATSFYNIIRTKIIDGKYFNIAINRSGLNIVVSEDKDVQALYSYYGDRSDFVGRFISHPKKLKLKFFLTDDNIEKTLKYLYVNFYKEIYDIVRLLIKYDGDYIFDKNIHGKFEIDNLYRLPLIQIKKEIEVELFLQGSFNPYDSEERRLKKFIFKKIGFMYNERRKKYGII